MTKVNVYVTLRESVVDPQGKATEEALHSLGFQEVKRVRIGKLIELDMDGSSAEVKQRVTEMCEKLLINQVIETYRLEVEEVAGQ